MENQEKKTVFSKEDLSKIVGGKTGGMAIMSAVSIMLADGCQTGICSIKINPSYCDGGAVCTSGIA
jgi:hypothetical protein